MNPQYVRDHVTLYFHLLYYLWITMISVTNSFGIHCCPSLKQVLKQFLIHYHPSRRKDFETVFEFTENGFWNCFWIQCYLSLRKVLNLILNSFFSFSEKVFETVFEFTVVLLRDRFLWRIFNTLLFFIVKSFLNGFWIHCCPCLGLLNCFWIHCYPTMRKCFDTVFEFTVVLLWDEISKVFFNLLLFLTQTGFRNNFESTVVLWNRFWKLF